MKLTTCAPLLLLGIVAAAAPASAQKTDWTTRCIREFGANNAPETGKYLLQTVGKTADAKGQVRFDYSLSGYGTAAVYPTDQKDLLNPYGRPGIGIGYYGPVDAKPPHAAKPAVGHVSQGVIAKDFQPIPGTLAKLKLVVDGASFGPFDPNESSVKSNGQYSVWLDTAETDGDSKPPVLDAKTFAALAKAVGAMKSAELVVVRDGVDIVRVPLPPPAEFPKWRDELAGWASKTRPGAEAIACGDQVVN
jgi:hypothetical protein